MWRVVFFAAKLFSWCQHAAFSFFHLDNLTTSLQFESNYQLHFTTSSFLFLKGQMSCGG